MSKIRQRLLEAFEAERREHLAAMHQLLEGPLDGAVVEELLRRAHTLKGASRAVDMPDLETLAHTMETAFVKASSGLLHLDEAARTLLQACLDGFEGGDARSLEKRLAAWLGGPPGASPTPAEFEPTSAPLPLPADTIRVRADHVHHLLRSAGQVVEEVGRHQLLAAELELLEHELRDLGHVSVRLRRARDLQTQATHALQLLGHQIQHDVGRVLLVPAGLVLEGFSKMVRDLAASEGKSVRFTVEGQEVEADRRVLQAMKDPLLHMLRNSIGHGVESPDERQRRGKPQQAQICLKLAVSGRRLVLTVSDDGRGIDVERVREVAGKKGLLRPDSTGDEVLKLVFGAGFSTSRVLTHTSGRGIGLSVVQEALARLQGEVAVENRPGQGVTFRFSLPITLAAQSLLVVRSHGQRYALPGFAIDRLARVERTQLERLEGRLVLPLEGQLVPVVSLAGLLQPGPATLAGSVWPVVLLVSGGRRLALVVDELLDRIDGLCRDLGPPVEMHPAVQAGLILADGSVGLVLNPGVLLEEAGKMTAEFEIVEKPADDVRQAVATILVVDDSLTTRTLERGILEAHGYRVVVATDGIEAQRVLAENDVNLVITDLQMPRLDGFGLLQYIKSERRYAHLPVILVTSLDRREDQERGLALGADAYIVKRSFAQTDLLETVHQLL